MNRGFTIIELMVSLAIFGIMTALVVAKYGTFNQSVLLTNLAYDTALVLRTAQTYSLSVKSALDTANPFQFSYGVEFSKSPTDEANKSFNLFADNLGSPNYKMDAGEKISAYNLKRNAIVSDLCVGYGTGGCDSVEKLDILFRRPDPNAIICAPGCGFHYAEITVQSSDGGTRKVLVRSNGLISVPN